MFSKRGKNHAPAVVLPFMHYNLARIYNVLRVTPGMAAGVTCHVWGIGENVDLLK